MLDTGTQILLAPLALHCKGAVWRRLEEVTRREVASLDELGTMTRLAGWRGGMHSAAQGRALGEGWSSEEAAASPRQRTRRGSGLSGCAPECGQQRLQRRAVRRLQQRLARRQLAQAVQAHGQHPAAQQSARRKDRHRQRRGTAQHGAADHGSAQPHGHGGWGHWQFLPANGIRGAAIGARLGAAALGDTAALAAGQSSVAM